jgi:hypothetical protein
VLATDFSIICNGVVRCKLLHFLVVAAAILQKNHFGNKIIEHQLAEAKMVDYCQQN